MRKFLSLFMIALMFCAVISIGCGGGGSDNNSADTEQTESLNQNTGEDNGSEDTEDYDSNEGGRSTPEGYIPEGYIWSYIEYQLIKGASTLSCTCTLYGRQMSTTFDGRKVLSKWIKLFEAPAGYDPQRRLLKNERPHESLISYPLNGGARYYITHRYVEFGFELSTPVDEDNDEKTYPYSGVFWTVDRGEAKKICIDVSSSTNSIAIKVNDQEIFKDSDCFSRIPYDWDAENKICARTVHTANYVNKETNFYARKSTEAKWDIIETSGKNRKFIDSNYVQFGFEFDIFWGTNWLYSNVFWGADKAEEIKSKDGKVQDIYVEMRGTSLYPHIYIYVNGQKVYEYTNCPSLTRYPWNSNGINVGISHTGGYEINEHHFYARKFGGSWEEKGNSGTFLVPDGYVEFGFEFDIWGGTRWPYSNVFYTAADSEKTPAKKIQIKTGGLIRGASITIYVNDKEQLYHATCDTHARYDWGTGPGLSAPTKVNILHQGAFSLSAINFWARKSGGKWENLYSKDNYSGEKTVPDGYVDFGFEFDIANPMEKYEQWPYSVPFWIAEEHPDCNVKSISITVGGYWWFFGSPHIDITVQGYDANGRYNKLYSYSNHELDYKDKSPNKGKQYSW